MERWLYAVWTTKSVVVLPSKKGSGHSLASELKKLGKFTTSGSGQYERIIKNL
jgi:hypothetical protein